MMSLQTNTGTKRKSFLQYIKYQVRLSKQQIFSLFGSGKTTRLNSSETIKKNKPD
jgi:hypothetical protein